MSQPSGSPPEFSPQDNLPEVTPPTAGFIFQLFIIPAAIVLVIIMVWLMFAWLAQMGGNPKDYVEDIQKNKANSWQLAYNLTTELRRDPVYRNDVELSNELARMLQERLPAPLPADKKSRSNETMLRVFLAKALGEFEVADQSIPVLLAAAGNADQEQAEVRKAAIEALALLSSNLDGEPLRDRSAAVAPILIVASEDDDYQVAERAAYALSLIGGSEAISRLEAIVTGVSYPNVRYNAATGLARVGNAKAIPVLLEMLDPAETAGLVIERNEELKEVEIESAKRHKQLMLLLNGLRATRQLAEKNQSADLSELRQAVQQLIEFTTEKQIRLEATDVLKALDARGGRSAAATVYDEVVLHALSKFTFIL